MWKIALVGGGGKLGMRIAEKLQEVNKKENKYDIRFVQKEGRGRERLEKAGIKISPPEEALPDAEIMILAVPDAAISEISAKLVPLLPPGAMVIGLDPAAAYAEVMPIRKDLSYFVAHPCHPSIFNNETTEEAQNDHFGGVAKQDIVCALYGGPEKDYEKGEEISRIMYGPVTNSYRVTIEQMAILEPALVETLGVTVHIALRDALDKAVQMGVPEAAARSFFFGHLQIIIAQVFGFVGYPMSDGAQLAARNAFSKIFRPDWMENVMRTERIKESVAEITRKK
ncbi:MAG: NAD(P)-binding domain-containing protein [Spirochaetaceae bacterium]|nr:NAD(P)-binding domain-containing protein [Spirochaetaceae bacterium]